MLCMLKLGGSLITDKQQAYTPKYEVIKRLACEIRDALTENPTLRLIIGHGSGSFGHYAAQKFATRYGVKSKEEWDGFLEVWHAARALNNILMQEFRQQNIPAITFAPSSCALSNKNRISSWQITPIAHALKNQLIPVVFGDVVFDTRKGGSIISTEEIFLFLSKQLKPAAILIAGIEDGVWANFPQRDTLIQVIDAQKNFPNNVLSGSQSPDVTGGMAEKVNLLKEMVLSVPSATAMIFSGVEPGNIHSALQGKNFGTIIHA